MSKDVSLPFEAVGEAAATELTGKTLLYTAWPRASATAAGRCKDLWEKGFKQLINVRMQHSQVFMPSFLELKKKEIFCWAVYMQ